MIAMIDDLDADRLVIQARGRAPVADARVPRTLLVLDDAIDLDVDCNKTCILYPKKLDHFAFKEKENL